MNPACECCPHYTVQALRDDVLLYNVWQECGDSGCLISWCELCRHNKRNWLRIYEREVARDWKREIAE